MKEKNSKARRLTYVISVVFGIIAFFIIIKGFIDMHAVMKNMHYFDEIYKSVDDTVQINGQTKNLILFPHGVLKHNTQTGEWYLREGSILWFETKDTFSFLTPGGKIRINKASGYVFSKRFPVIFLKKGEIDYYQTVLRGENLYYNDYKKSIDTLHDLQVNRPFYFIGMEENDTVRVYKGNYPPTNKTFEYIIYHK